MVNLNIFDSIIFILISAGSFYAIESINFTKILKSSNPRKAFVLYAFLAFALSALVFTFYIYLKLLYIKI